MKNLKSIVEIALIIIFIIVAIFVLFEDTTNVKDELLAELLNYTGTVDDQIETLISDKRYKSLDYADKEHLVRCLLIYLNMDDKIGEYQYDSDNKLMIFRYLDGKQGIISIE